MENKREQTELTLLTARIDYLINHATRLKKVVDKMDASTHPDYKQLADFVVDSLTFEENPELKLELELLKNSVPELEERFKNLPEKYKNA